MKVHFIRTHENHLRYGIRNHMMDINLSWLFSRNGLHDLLHMRRRKP